MSKTARDIMTVQVITVEPKLHVNALIELMTEKKISCAPVVNKRGRLVGIVTKTDVLGHFMDLDLDVTVRVGLKDILDSTLDYSGLEVTSTTELTVDKIMTRKPVCVPEDTPVKELAELMIKKNIHRLIVSRDKQICGIVSTLDVLYYVAGIEREK